MWLVWVYFQAMSILPAVQAMLRAPLESTHLGFKSALVTHALCGQLAGSQRHCAEAEARSLAACTKVTSLIPSAGLAEMAGLCDIQGQVSLQKMVLLMQSCHSGHRFGQGFWHKPQASCLRLLARWRISVTCTGRC